jgi:hypothetical protein
MALPVKVTGLLEYWSIGVLEYWQERNPRISTRIIIPPLLHYSITPADRRNRGKTIERSLGAQPKARPFGV